MPWSRMAMKDATTCDKPGGAGRELGSRDFRMGEPSQQMLATVQGTHNCAEATQGTETSKYLEEKKERSIP
jgi:hypothetical protein